MRVFLAAAGVLLTFAGLGLSARKSLAWDGPLCSLDGVQVPGAMSVPAAVRRSPILEPAYCIGVPDSVRQQELDSLRVEPVWMADPAGRAPLDSLEGVEAWEQFLELRDKGDLQEALLHLTVVEAAFPALADRFALLRGEVRMELGDYDRAVQDFLIARDSLDSAVRAKSRILRIETKMLADHSDADSALVDLLKFYPALPDGPRLRFALAQWNERGSRIQDAVRIYRDLYLSLPGTAVAQKARARLEVLREQGVPVRPLTPAQEIARVETMARRGPHGLAREEAARLLEDDTIVGALRNRVHLVAARLARVEGRFEDAAMHMREGGRQAGEGDEDRTRAVQRLTGISRSVRATETAAALKQIAGLRNGRPWMAVPPARLLGIVRVAAAAGIESALQEALRTLSRLRGLTPGVAFEAGVLASGTGPDGLVAGLFMKAAEVRGSRGVAARYHHARTLERLGQYARAEREYLLVQQADHSETHWYALWSELRLRVVRQALLCDCDPELEPAAAAQALAAKGGGKGSSAEQGQRLPSLRQMLSGTPLPEPDASSNQTEPGEPAEDVPFGPAPGNADVNAATDQEVDLQALIARLAPLAERHREHYPWFGRARDLLELGLPEEAADELHEGYLAWRDARGRPLRRAGIEAVFRGTEAPIVPVSAETRRGRRQIDQASIQEWIEISSALGDEGTAVGLSGWSRANERPRAYQGLVEAAAERNGLDPNLLLAVMRTESVYQRRIVSYAGAIGLMQIMPRTGRHIAFALEKEDYDTDDLLDPETNLEFAAWYLASLIERFDGHLPLAIASYNGGPHNVRSWLRQHPDDMPMEAFLERIPFEQTHRYVRRVLSHYAAYREQQGLPMVALKTDLPSVEADPVGF